MRKIFTLLVALFLTATVFAQSPQKMSYQAVIRDASGVLITNTQVGMQISILQGSASGPAVFVETQEPSTNANGLVGIEIGAGTVESGDFTTIDWANGPYFIKTETDPTGGETYTITGTSQLLSVPYALHAKTAEAVTGGITETDPTFTISAAANITATDLTNLGNLSGTNTGDQDISGISTNATAISTIQSEQTTQNAAIALNTAKTGITTAQADAIVANTAKVGITTAQADAIVANTAKVGITTAQADAIVANTAKVGITTAQADAIVANSAKVGITTAQANAIVANTAKVGITAAQVTKLDGIAENANNYTHPTGDGNLHVPATGTTNNGKVLTAGATAGSLSWNALTSSQWTSTGSDIYYNTGNVGIGTTTPGHKLTVDGAGDSNTGVLGIDISGDASFTWASVAIAPNLSADNNLIHMIGKEEAEYNCGYMGFNFKENGSSANFLTFGLHSHDNLLNLTGAGNVGIGTTTPGTTLSVNGTLSLLGNSTSYIGNSIAAGRRILELRAGTSNSTGAGINLYGNDDPTNPDAILFYASGSERMRVSSTGNIGIGTTTPSYKLDISSGDDAGIRIGPNSTYSRSLVLGGYTASDFSEARIQTSNGNLHLDAKEPLDGYGSGIYLNYHHEGNVFLTAGGGSVGIGTGGASGYKLYVNGNVWCTSLTQGSDIRLKKDVISIDNGLDKVMQLRPVTFNWKQDDYPDMNLDDRNHVGFIAQEVEKIVPQVVSTAEDEMQTKSIAYSDLVPVLTKAIQEQQAIIENQQKQIDELKKMLEGLMKK